MLQTLARLRIPLVAIIVTFVTAGTGFAIEANVLKADIPFEFIVAGKTMPAGTYEIKVGPGITNPPVLAIETESPSENELRFKKVLATTTPAGKVDDRRPQLVFEKVGDLHFLSKVVPASGTVKKVEGAPER